MKVSDLDNISDDSRLNEMFKDEMEEYNSPPVVHQKQ
jgi:hypothetical protein